MYSLDNLLDELRQAARDGDLPAVADVVRNAIGEMPFVYHRSARRNCCTANLA